MSDYFLGEIRMFPFAWAPENWLLCNGAVLQVSQNQALFSLLNKQYGGDGRTTFALPDLRGRVPLSSGNSATYGSYSVGQAGGFESVTLTATQVPSHTHSFNALSTVGAASTPAGGAALVSSAKPVGTPAVVPSLYGAVTGTSTFAPLNSGTINTVGGGAHGNMQPFTVLNFCIAAVGLYPSRS